MSKRSFECDRVFTKAYNRASPAMQVWFEDEADKAADRIKRAKPAIPLWDWGQEYEVLFPGNGWNLPRKLPEFRKRDADNLVKLFTK